MAQPTNGPSPTSKTANKSYSGPLLWVDDRPGQLSPTKHRHVVHSHVQRSYLSWKRKDEQDREYNLKQPLEGQQFAYRQAPVESKLIEKNERVRATANTCAKIMHSRVRKHEVQKVQPWPRDEQFEKSTLGLFTINMCGNSDPFDAFPIPITPRVSQLLSFCVDVYLPSAHRDAAMPQAHTLREDWFEFNPALEDDCCAYSILTRLSRAICPNSMQNRELAIPALKFHNRSVSILKARLQNQTAMRSPGTQAAILSLLIAANYSQNFREALFHARILSHLIQSGTITPSLRFVHYTWYYDYQRSMMSMSRACFDNECWIPTYFTPTWSAFMDLLPEEAYIIHLENSIDPCIHDATLRNIFAELRHCYTTLLCTLKDAALQTQLAVTYLRTKTIHCGSRMHKYWLDLRKSPGERFNDKGLTSPPLFETAFEIPSSYHTSLVQPVPSSNDRLTLMPPDVARFVILAMHVWIRSVGQIDSCHVGNRTDGVYRANDLLLSEMKKAIISWDQNTCYENRRRYGNARLFATYVGAQMEWASFAATSCKLSTTSATTITMDKSIQGSSKVYGPVRGFFTLRLAEQARALALTGWEQVSEILVKNFIYTDTLTPHPSTWF